MENWVLLTWEEIGPNQCDIWYNQMICKIKNNTLYGDYYIRYSRTSDTLCDKKFEQDSEPVDIEFVDGEWVYDGYLPMEMECIDIKNYL